MERTFVGLAKTTIVVLTVLGVIFLIRYLFSKEVEPLAAMIICFGISGSFFFGGLRIIPEEERWVIQALGRFYNIIGPGLVWICPFLMKPRRRWPIWRLPVEMFLEKPWIDFKVGGRARLVQPILWLRVIGAKEKKEKEMRENIYKLVYEIEDVVKAAREYTELRFRAVLNTLLPDEALMMVYEKQISWWKVIIDRFPDLPSTFAEWGVEAAEITVSDYEWSEEVATKRREVYEHDRDVRIAEYDAEAAVFRADEKSLKTGGVIARIGTALKKQGYKDDEAKELAPKVFNFVIAAETGSLFLTRLEKGEAIGPLVAEIAATMKATGEKYKKEKSQSKTDSKSKGSH